MTSEHEKDNELLLKLSTDISKNKKRLSEIVDQLMKERNIKIENCNITVWHQLIRDAEAIAFEEKKII